MILHVSLRGPGIWKIPTFPERRKRLALSERLFYLWCTNPLFNFCLFFLLLPVLFNIRASGT